LLRSVRKNFFVVWAPCCCTNIIPCIVLFICEIQYALLASNILIAVKFLEFQISSQNLTIVVIIISMMAVLATMT